MVTSVNMSWNDLIYNGRCGAVVATMSTMFAGVYCVSDIWQKERSGGIGVEDGLRGEMKINK